MNGITKTALIPIADGSEDLEAVTMIDILRRADIDVTVASIAPKKRLQITASRNTKIVADRHIDDCIRLTYDLIALPGGMPGAEHLRDCTPLIAMLNKQKENGRLFGAICASPAIVFSSHKLDENRKTTCNPAFTEQLGQFENKRVVVDQNCVTSQGPGTAIEFSLVLVGLLLGDEARAAVASPMVL